VFFVAFLLYKTAMHAFTAGKLAMIAKKLVVFAMVSPKFAPRKLDIIKQFQEYNYNRGQSV
jgi:hypothetical protein